MLSFVAFSNKFRVKPSGISLKMRFLPVELRDSHLKLRFLTVEVQFFCLIFFILLVELRNFCLKLRFPWWNFGHYRDPDFAIFPVARQPPPQVGVATALGVAYATESPEVPNSGEVTNQHPQAEFQPLIPLNDSTRGYFPTVSDATWRY